MRRSALKSKRPQRIREEHYNITKEKEHYSRAMSRVASIHETEMNIRIPLWSFRDVNGILKIFPKVGT